MADWREAHPGLAARANDPDIQAMAAACDMDVETFLLEQLAAGFDAAEQHHGQRQDGKTSAGSLADWQRTPSAGRSA